MSVIKRVTAVFMAVLLLMTTAVAANAEEITEADRKEITDEIFELLYPDGLTNEYRKLTQTIVKVEHNPLAAMAYMRIEAEVSICNDDLLQELSNGKIDLEEFFEKDEFDYTIAKKKDKYKNSLILGSECWYQTYDYGIWTFGNEKFHEFYGYFKEDDENFTLYEDGTDKVLGIYPKLIGYEYLDDEAGNGGSGEANGGSGSAGGNSGAGSVISSEYSNDEADYAASKPKSSSNSDEKVMGTPSTYENDEDGASPRVVSGNNPAVTPEIVSAVDEMKSAANAKTQITTTTTATTSAHSSHTIRNVIIFIIVLAVIVVLVCYITRVKNGNKKSNN